MMTRSGTTKAMHSERRRCVFTLQTYDLRSFSGPIDLAVGSYRNDANVSAAQRHLYDLIKEDQVVWCGQDEPFLYGAKGHFLHDIEVDSRDLVVVIDSFVWSHLIDNKSRYIPPDELADLRHQAAMSDDYDKTLRKLEDSYLAQNLPEDPWASVSKVAVTEKSDQLLIKFPFVFSTIGNVDIVTEEMESKGSRRTTRKINRVRAAVADGTPHTT